MQDLIDEIVGQYFYSFIVEKGAVTALNNVFQAIVGDIAELYDRIDENISPQQKTQIALALYFPEWWIHLVKSSAKSKKVFHAFRLFVVENLEFKKRNIYNTVDEIIEYFFAQLIRNVIFRGYLRKNILEMQVFGRRELADAFYSDPFYLEFSKNKNIYILYNTDYQKTKVISDAGDQIISLTRQHREDYIYDGQEPMRHTFTFGPNVNIKHGTLNLFCNFADICLKQ